ncbi:MAG: 50S ribosomal protein L9, partial [Candidatus Hydrogenedentota bacterium]
MELQDVAKGLGEVTVEFTAKAGSEGKLFGSITTLHIANQLKEQGHEVNRKKIKLAEPIKTAGDHSVTVLLGAGVEATIKIVVTAEVVVADEPVDDFVDTDDDDEGATMAMAEEEGSKVAKKKVKAPA